MKSRASWCTTLSGLLTVAAAGILCTANPAIADSATPCKSTATGDLRLLTLNSTIFQNTRTIRVLLPAGYDAPENAARRYPVLYMLDGQNLFDACLSEVSHHEWGVDETVYRLTRQQAIPAMIVVGIDHAGKDRAREFLPYKDYVGNPGMAEPAGQRFPDFLTDEVMPLVAANYRVLPGHSNTGIGGSSYGGVAALYALLAKPTMFGYGLIESPTLWIGMGQLVRDTAPLAAAPIRVFVAVGGKETGDPRAARVMKRMFATLTAHFRAAGYSEREFRYVFEPDAKHTEAAWEKRLPGALTFLYSGWKEEPGPH